MSNHILFIPITLIDISGNYLRRLLRITEYEDCEVRLNLDSVGTN